MKSRYIIVRLGAAFGCLLLILVAVGWLGIVKMNSMTVATSRITSEQWNAVELSRDALRCSSANSRITMQIFLIGGGNQPLIQALLKEQLENSAKISNILEHLAHHVDSPEEKHLLDSIRAKRIPYVESYRRALRLLLDENKRREAQALMNDEVLPRIIAYHNAWEDFVQFQGSEVKQTAQLMESRFHRAREQVLALLAVGVLLGCSIAVYVTRSLIRQIEVRQQAEMLKKMRDELEVQVARRTAELKAANVELQASSVKLSTAHEQLQSSERRFRTLSESAPMGIYLTDGHKKILYSNPYC